MNSKYIENANKYGTVTFEGVEYALTCDADCSNRFLPFGVNWFDASFGETYMFEMTAYAIDKKGAKYEISWIFEDVKGEEKDLDCHDYNDVCSVRAL